MASIRIVTTISANIERCFDLARCIDFHVESLAATGERAVAGRTSGLIELGESVTWEARHLGVTQRFTSQITKFDRPKYFRDEMIDGAFQTFVHDHYFQQSDRNTIMIDEIVFRSPFGLLGRTVDFLFLEGYMRRLLEGRSRAIQLEAETAESHTSC